MCTPTLQSAFAALLQPRCGPRCDLTTRPSPARFQRLSPNHLLLLLIAGYMLAGSRNDFALARWLPSGQLDGSFDGDGDGDNDGKITTDFVRAADYA